MTLLHPLQRAHHPFRRLALGSLLAAGMASQAFAGFTIFEGTAATPGAITPTRDAFRTAIGGGTVAGANGDFGGLRREINWDGVPDSFSDPNLLPANFFNSTSPRGVVFSTPGSGFLVSANSGLATSSMPPMPSSSRAMCWWRVIRDSRSWARWPTPESGSHACALPPGRTPSFPTGFEMISAATWW
jgi:hypothetical protein